MEVKLSDPPMGVWKLAWSITLLIIILPQHCHGDCINNLNTCEWYPWASWSSCSRTCGGGIQTRTRSLCCKADLDYDACLRDCSLPNTGRETQSCNTDCQHGGTYSNGYCHCPPLRYGICCERDEAQAEGDCAKRCTWTNWRSWSSCSTACGGGTRTRTRNPCCLKGLTFDQCISNCTFSSTDQRETSACSGYCSNGGTVSTSFCSCPPGYGGACCDIENTPGDCTKCSLLAWSNWGSCSETCGGGEQSRTRKPCCRLQQSQQECMAECGLTGEDLQMTHNCSQTCDHGVFTNSQCHCYDGYRGRCCNLDFSSLNHVTCHMHVCCSLLSIVVRAECNWAPWNNWRRCTRTCGGGTCFG
ncbi:A disintegrin and metalloproteinase with thrombospondin motifs adt-1-like isoform X4 [Haliotis cracherodii]|uniref:A disintegrin and metalloproteinase with thrombospondin motifs adt-1-like isoform X4 n=1 Tax=Haliotis cracherodii TaxID=6455 RepID=UPI0039ECCC9A